MKNSVREHVLTGLQLGLGMVAGICTMAVLVYGVDKLRYPEVDDSLFTFLKSYPPRLVGGISVAIALAVLVSTLDRWAKMLAGLFAYGAFGALLAVLAGGFHSPIAALQLNRFGAALMAALLSACALLTVRFGRDGLGWVDRAAALAAPPLLIWAGTSNKAITGFEVLVALVALFVVAAVYHHIRDQSKTGAA